MIPHEVYINASRPRITGNLVPVLPQHLISIPTCWGAGAMTSQGRLVVLSELYSGRSYCGIGRVSLFSFWSQRRQVSGWADGVWVGFVALPQDLGCPWCLRVFLVALARCCWLTVNDLLVGYPMSYLLGAWEHNVGHGARLVCMGKSLGEKGLPQKSVLRRRYGGIAGVCVCVCVCVCGYIYYCGFR